MGAWAFICCLSWGQRQKMLPVTAVSMPLHLGMGGAALQWGGLDQTDPEPFSAYVQY